MLAPFAPHLCEELWLHLGHETTSLFSTEWPAVDEAALVVEEVEIVIQIRGKIRGRARVPRGIGQDQALETARGLPSVRTALEGKEVLRAIWVQDKLLNIVVKVTPVEES
jgi:leucyl-tRNA synthetase